MSPSCWEGSPLLAAFVIVTSTYSGEARRAFWRRVFTPRGIRGLWWIAIIAIAAGGRVLALLVAAALGLDTGDALEAPAAIAAAGVVAFAFAAGFAEEPGWRGVAHDGVGARFGFAIVGLLIGVAWALWHVPLYFLEGTFQHGLGFGSAGFWLISATLLPWSVLYAWLVEHTGRSVFAAVLIHAAGNATSELLPASDVVRVLELAALAAAALTAVVLARRSDQSRTREE